MEENKELEQEIHNEAMKLRTCPCYDELAAFARHFANWQKQQDQSTIELAEDHAMLAGMEMMKEQMMEDAVDATIDDAGYQPMIKMNVPNGFSFGDKVKVIIIKGENER